MHCTVFILRNSLHISRGRFTQSSVGSDEGSLLPFMMVWHMAWWSDTLCPTLIRLCVPSLSCSLQIVVVEIFLQFCKCTYTLYCHEWIWHLVPRKCIMGWRLFGPDWLLGLPWDSRSGSVELCYFSIPFLYFPWTLKLSAHSSLQATMKITCTWFSSILC